MDPGLISIGKLAKATGFSVERLRMWELRYGQPQGQRLPSGHRRYGAEEVERLHLVRRALEQGMRPRQVVALPREALQQRLEKVPPSARTGRGLPWSPKAWVQAASRMDEAYLNRHFYEQWLDLGTLRFLKERAYPFVWALGEEWQKGSLCAAEEHFGSEKLGDFLAGVWRRLNEQNRFGPVLFSTLPGDQHRLGLQMAALAAALAGLKVAYLGPSTPLQELALKARDLDAKGVLISVALGRSEGDTEEQLRALRRSLPAAVMLGVGGAGAPAAPADGAWQRFGDLDAFHDWARAWCSKRGQAAAAA